jgi:hypothetical protein
MEVNGQLHTTFTLALAKELTVYTVYEAGWAPEHIWMLWKAKVKKSCILWIFFTDKWFSQMQAFTMKENPGL